MDNSQVFSFSFLKTQLDYLAGNVKKQNRTKNSGNEFEVQGFQALPRVEENLILKIYSIPCYIAG